MDDVERWLEGRGHLVALERRAGHDEAQERRPFGLALLLAKLLGAPGDLQKPDSPLDVALINPLMTLDPNADLGLLVSEAGGTTFTITSSMQVGILGSGLMGGKLGTKVAHLRAIVCPRRAVMRFSNPAAFQHSQITPRLTMRLIRATDNKVNES